MLMVAQQSIKAQVLKDLQTSFNNYAQNVFQEKIFVHTDKEQYLSGEILWFKLYTVNALTNTPAQISKIAYVDVLDENNRPFFQAKISLKSGVGSGSFYLPTSLSNGNYKLRAYTSWMKNIGPSLFFEKTITVINALNPLLNETPVKNATALQFFPEGGDLVEGMISTIGFNAIDAFGKGVEVTGAIVNQKNDTVARFKSQKFGIGKFTFTPLANQTYRAVAFSSNRELINKQLPEAKKQGYSLHLSDGDALLVNVSTNLKESKVHLIVHGSNQINLAETASLTNGQASFTLDRAKLAAGLSHLTLFNENGEAVAERLYFKRPVDKLNITANTDLKQYEQRKPVQVNLALTKANGQATNGDLSIAVKRLDSLQGMDQTDILSYILLSAEVKGTIESPSYYFMNEDKETNEALDNLLITQGWRRFNWSTVAKNANPSFQFLPEFNGHLINGKITRKDGTPKQNTVVYLSIPKVKNQFYQAVSDVNGNFTFNTKDIYGLNEIVVQTDHSDTTSVLSINNPFAEQFNQATPYRVNLASKPFANLQRYSLGTQVQNTYSANQLKQVTRAKVDTTLFYGRPFKTYKLNDYTRFKTIEETLREYVTQTFVTKATNYQIRLLGNDVSLNGNPLVLVDGTPYFDMDKVMKIDPYKIERIEILPEKYYLGSSSYEGILSFFSFKPSLANIDINPNAIVLDYEGMQKQREFYSPAYDTTLQQGSRIPDFRNVLYWSPAVNINAAGKGQLKFYTSDFPGTYIGIINGLTKDGVPGTTSFTFQVKEK